MARGFESKDVEFQQAERERGRETRPALTPGQRAEASRRQTLELSLARLRADLEAAQRPAHRAMLAQAIATLEAERASFTEAMMQARSMFAGAIALSLLAVVGCGSSTSSTRSASSSAGQPPVSAPAAAPEPPARTDNRPRVVILGDSITAGLGLSPEQAYPTLIQQKIDAASLDYHVVNAGVSGDTSAGGLSRLDWALDGDVKVMVVALGGNDGLRGLPPEELQKNLATIIKRAQARKIAVVLAGMEAPPNFGQTYTVSFRRVYADLAKGYGVPLIPFLLQGVAGIEGLNQRDGIHPTAEGARTVADNVWTVLRPTLKGS